MSPAALTGWEPARRAAAALRAMLAERTDDRRAGHRDRHARRGRRPDAGDRRARRGRGVRGARAPARRRRALHRGQRGARDGRLRRRRRARGRRPDRRLAERQARPAAPLRLDRRRRRARRWPTSCSASCRTSGRDEEWVAWRGGGAQLNGLPLDPALGERRSRDGKLELRRLRVRRPALGARSRRGRSAEVAHRLRAIGTIAAALCQVAAARFDGMLTRRAAARSTPPPRS